MYSDPKILTRIYLQALVPNMIAILGGTINVLFDGIMVGRKMGDIGIASVNQSLAVYLFLCMAGSLIAAGGSAKTALAIGANRVQEGQDYYSLSVETAVVLGVAACVLGYLFSAPIAAFLGSGASVELVRTYIRITFAGGIFKILLYIPFFYLRLDGRMKQSAAAMLTMTVLNIALDYLFLFVFDWGIAGAAWASAIATAVACVMSFAFMGGRTGSFKFRFVAPDRKMLAEIVKNGSPMAANNLFSALRIMGLNAIMNTVGGSAMVAVFAITNSLNEFSICIQNGVPQAGSAMLGIYHGEQDSLSVKRLLKLQLTCGFWLSAAFAAVLIVTGGRIGLLFGSSQDIRFAVFCLALSIVIGTLNSVMTYYYYAIARPGMANLITVLRIFVMSVGSAWVFRALGNGIWIFFWAAELLTAALWTGAACVYTKRAGGKANLYMMDETALLEGKSINFTVACDTEEICGASEKISEFCDSNGFSPDQTMTVSLALEELMVIIAEKSMNYQGAMDVRILRTADGGILRIRSEGKYYNPLEFAEDGLDYLGVSLIMKMAKKTEYQSTLGLNTLIVVI